MSDPNTIFRLYFETRPKCDSGKSIDRHSIPNLLWLDLTIKRMKLLSSSSSSSTCFYTQIGALPHKGGQRQRRRSRKKIIRHRKEMSQLIIFPLMFWCEMNVVCVWHTAEYSNINNGNVRVHKKRSNDNDCLKKKKKDETKTSDVMWLCSKLNRIYTSCIICAFMALEMLMNRFPHYFFSHSEFSSRYFTSHLLIFCCWACDRESVPEWKDIQQVVISFVAPAPTSLPLCSPHHFLFIGCVAFIFQV